MQQQHPCLSVGGWSAQGRMWKRTHAQATEPRRACRRTRRWARCARGAWGRCRRQPEVRLGGGGEARRRVSALTARGGGKESKSGCGGGRSGQQRCAVGSGLSLSAGAGSRRLLLLRPLPAAAAAAAVVRQCAALRCSPCARPRPTSCAMAPVATAAITSHAAHHRHVTRPSPRRHLLPARNPQESSEPPVIPTLPTSPQAARVPKRPQIVYTVKLQAPRSPAGAERKPPAKNRLSKRMLEPLLTAVSAANRSPAPTNAGDAAHAAPTSFYPNSSAADTPPQRSSDAPSAVALGLSPRTPRPARFLTSLPRRARRRDRRHAIPGFTPVIPPHIRGKCGGALPQFQDRPGQGSLLR